MTRFLLHTTVPSFLDHLKIWLTLADLFLPIFCPKATHPCWFERRRQSAANCGWMVRDSAIQLRGWEPIKLENGEPIKNHHRSFECYDRWPLRPLLPSKWDHKFTPHDQLRDACCHLANMIEDIDRAMSPFAKLLWPFFGKSLRRNTNPLTPNVAIGTAIKHPVSDHSDAQAWAPECPDVKNYKWRLNLVWHRMLYSRTHVATVGVKGLTKWRKPYRLLRLTDIVEADSRPVVHDLVDDQVHHLAVDVAEAVIWRGCGRGGWWSLSGLMLLLRLTPCAARRGSSIPLIQSDTFSNISFWHDVPT